jgi:hypothetical protein
MMRRIEIVPGNLIKGTSDERLERIDGWGQSSYCELGEERRKKSVRRDVEEDKRVPHVVLALPTTLHLLTIALYGTPILQLRKILNFV